MRATLVGRDLAPFDQRLRDLVFARLGALLDQMPCCAIGDIGFGQQWCFFTQPLCKPCDRSLETRVRFLDRFGPDMCGKAMCGLVETGRGGGEGSLRPA